MDMYECDKCNDGCMILKAEEVKTPIGCPSYEEDSAEWKYVDLSKENENV